MAIRFACPSCQQPIEIDEQWAGESVACPYCKNVVTAPRSSTWPPGEIPMASAAGSAFQRPPMPPGTGIPPEIAGHYRPVRSGSNSAPWALTLAITGAVLCLIGWFAWILLAATLALEKVGPDATPKQQQEAMEEIRQDMIRGKIPDNPPATAAAVIGTLSGLGGLVLSVRSLLRQERRRGMAIAACIISASFSCCHMPLLFIGCMPKLPPSSAPVSSQPLDPN